MEKQNFFDLNFYQLKNFLIDKAEVDTKKAKMQAQLDDIDAKIAEAQTQIQWYNDNIGG